MSSGTSLLRAKCPSCHLTDSVIALIPTIFLPHPFWPPGGTDIAPSHQLSDYNTGLMLSDFMSWMLCTQDGWGSYCPCLHLSSSRTSSSIGFTEVSITAWSTQTSTSRIMRGKCRRHTPVTRFTQSTASCRAYRITSTCLCSRCTRCCTWHSTLPSTSGRCRSTTATSRFRHCCSR